MKISYYDMFDLLSEESIDLLTNHMNKQELEKNIYQNFDSTTTLKDVTEMLPKNKKRKLDRKRVNIRCNYSER